MNFLTHFIDSDGSIKRKPGKKVTRRLKKKKSRVGKLGIVRLHGEDLEKLRRECFERDGYRCQSKTYGIRCLRVVTWDGYEAGHMAHIRTKRNNGDTLDNVRTLCAGCHAKEHNCGGKPCPPKH